MGGVIREASVSSLLSNESVEGWLGCPWVQTVPDFVEDKVRRIVDDARGKGISAFRQLTQRFPSGREVPIEYTTVLLGGSAGMLAVGKSLLAVAELQSRFIAAQQTMERDYWKLREVETRYRLLFNHSSEAVLVLKVGTFAIEEANPAALQALGLNASGAAARRSVMSAIPEGEQQAFRAMLLRAQDQGKAPGILVHLGEAREQWLVRASSMKGETGPMLLLQLVPAQPKAAKAIPESLPSTDAAIGSLPDGFVLIDQDGVIRRANQAFVDLVEFGSVDSVVGERLERWIWRPGADIPALLSILRTHQVARLFPSALHSELGTETEVEISATATPLGHSLSCALLIRDVGRRLGRQRDPKEVRSLIESVAEPVGKMPLRQLVKSAVDGVERHYVKAALDLVGGNRTAAAELLGLSRQSLYVKLGRYGFDNEDQTAQKEEE
ncbi:transcriptional regulator PpsR [Hyphomicrobiales bacterium BP6-180914]|uniref:Transcriptional regulator PpsR n=2 Tax=Lichenifustis flavocetrariae TaxID=2949735 RepID=A0AA42CLG8_9HYPH|nr:transcriptional regulator PpsR [Lichenifustis flavocetrariae]